MDLNPDDELKSKESCDIFMDVVFVF